ncbi:OmpL47-type beta-barrel domain-containing protein [Cohnella rhizosphaerae]|uniref:Carbohydrate-binding protein n=1 Tax=Cohnella rhizosphaerae TaxID=1457232 RepID=A0A9X4QRU5_9BACL|nr:carbohydrate-binding protein [Cohnella rhizosphaerae]MDG0808633.1 carbohydrate-binding protein [Cohnella rhizosphaerae]
MSMSIRKRWSVTPRRAAVVLLALLLLLPGVPGGFKAYADTTRDAFATQQAEGYDAANGVRITNDVINDLRGGSWARYDDVDFASGAKDVVLKIGLPDNAAGYKVEIRLDALDGQLIGTLITQSTGGYGKPAEQATTVQTVGGVHDVFLVFVGGVGIGNLDWFKFNGSYSVTDTAPPVTTGALTGEYTGTYYKSAVTATLSAIDYYSGVASTVYSLDGGTNWQAYSSPLKFNLEGVYELQYKSIDKAGNTETAKSLSFTLDELPLPSLFQVTQTVLPGEIAMLIGENLGTVTSVVYERLADDNVDAAEPAYVRLPHPDAPFNADDDPRAVTPEWEANAGETLDLLQPGQQSLKFKIPEDAEPGVYAVHPIVEGKETPVIYLNAPDIVWAQGDQGVSATPGGWVRLNGRNLSVTGKTPQIVLEAVSGGALTRLAASKTLDAYSVEANLPPSLAEGDYRVYLHNGTGGATAWSNSALLHVEAAQAWPQTVYNVKDYGATGNGTTNDTASVMDALAAAEAGGGGIVYFPRGRYHLTRELAVPTRTVIRGESQRLTQVFWSPYEWELNELPAALLTGTHDFAVEDISLQATRTGNIIVSDVSTPAAGNVFIRRVRINANPFAGHVTPDVEKLIADEVRARGTIDALRIGGKNVQIVDSSIYSPNRPLNLDKAEGALVRGNTFYNGLSGWYSLSAPDGLIFEDNRIIGADMTSTGGGVDKPTNHKAQNIYFARNSFKNSVGWDREAMTNDGGSGAYYGKIGTIDGTTLTLPNGGSAASWVAGAWNGGGGVFILSGKGAGQFRAIVSHTKDVVTLDSPFEFQPDATSVISITAIQRDGIYVENTFDNTGYFQFYGGAVNMVFDGNQMTQAGGFNAWGRFLYNGYQPDWYIDVVGNTFVDGNYSHFYGINDRWSGSTTLRITAQGNDTLQIGTTVRRNQLKDASTISIAGGTPLSSMRDIVVGGNTIQDADKGISVFGGVEGVVLDGNQFSGVATPLAITQQLLDGGKVLVLPD